MFREEVTLMVNQTLMLLDRRSLCQVTGWSWLLAHISMMASMVLILDMSACTPGMEPAMFKEGMTLMVSQAEIYLARQSLCQMMGRSWPLAQ
jgi:hypothetical protein